MINFQRIDTWGSGEEGTRGSHHELTAIDNGLRSYLKFDLRSSDITGSLSAFAWATVACAAACWHQAGWRLRIVGRSWVLVSLLAARVLLLLQSNGGSLEVRG